MTEVSSSAHVQSSKTTGGAFYRLVWKWHFLASLYVLPFMLMLSLTGGVYLYKPQIENWLYADQFFVEPQGQRVPLEQQIENLKAAVDVQRLRGITVFDDENRSTQIEFDDAEKTRTYGWVDPYDGEILGTAARDTMPMRLLRKFHGELLLGDVGTKFVELSAHWAIVMFITGAYLWWPRGKRTLVKAVSVPTGNGRSWWRETHMFTGFLAVVLVVPILVTGLPWTDVWGGGLSYVQEQTGQKSKSLRFGGKPIKSTISSGTPLALDSIILIAKNEGLTAPYEMRPATKPDASIWIRSASTKRSEQTELVVDQYSGELLRRIDFSDQPPVAKAVSWGISFHQGELYGWLNLAQNTLAAVLGIVLSVSGFVAWWMRRPAGSLGVPKAPNAALSKGMVALVVALIVLFPLMGATLILALILDGVLFRRMGWFRTE